MTMRYAKSKRGGGKAKRKGAKNNGHPVAQWRRANPAFITRAHVRDNGPAGEFRTQERKYSDGSEQHCGHVHLQGCTCFSDAAWGRDTGSSEEYIAMRDAAKAAAKRRAQHDAHGARCSRHFTVLPLSGTCTECESAG